MGTATAPRLGSLSLATLGVCLCAILARPPAPAAGQEPEEVGETGSLTLVGTVRAAADGRPVAAALIRLPELERQTLTGADGRFTLGDLPAGSHILEVSLLGFAPTFRTVELVEGETTRLEIALAVRPIELPELEAEVEGRGFLPGFLRRMESEAGYFITAGDIEERRPVRLTDMLRSYPETRVRYSPYRTLAPWSLGMLDPAGGECVPALVVDGRFLPREWWSVNDFSPRRVLAIEVYPNPSKVPETIREDLRFLTSGSPPSDCGAVLIWTRLDARLPG